MKASKPLAAALALVIASFVASAQTAAEHAQHHPAAAPLPSAAPAAPEAQLSDMDRHLQHMREMSRKMAEARTPEERQTLMAEHRQVMRDGMKMMGQMQGKPMAGMGMMEGTGTQGGMGPQMMQRHALMEKRMEMMQSMMQMMMDQMSAPSPK
jgi:hypothetical protein